MSAARKLDLDDETIDAIAERVIAKLRAPRPRAKPTATPRKLSDAARAKHKPGPPPMFAIFVSAREHGGPCVYVLLLEGAVVYVGKTRDGFSTRAAEHFTNKRFDTIVTLDFDFGPGDDVDPWLFALEEAACKVLRPTLNHRSALRGEPHRVAAWACCIDDLGERIARACKITTAPRYTPSAAIDLHAAMERR